MMQRDKSQSKISSIKKHRQPTLEERLAGLEQAGVLVKSAAPKQPLKPVARRPGALARFLAERGN